MILTVVIASAACLAVILSVLFFPTVRLGRLRLGTYWIMALLGALFLLLTRRISIAALFAGLTAESAVNPLKILVLFLSMTSLSVYLDEVGFFRYLAAAAIRRAGHRQTVLFLFLYLLVSVLTVFTSNDVIILTFTPFICYFCGNARINPIPYLTAEFLAANTWSMALLIGNPTNIYLGGSAEISFPSYAAVMLLPTVLAGFVSFALLYLVFRRSLSVPMEPICPTVTFRRRAPIVLGLVHLIGCTVLLAISSYIGLEMWWISLGFALLLFLSGTILAVHDRRRPTELKMTLLRLPWQLVPFVLSMFTIVLALSEYGVTGRIAALLGSSSPILLYGVTSYLASNLFNNIPMSVLFSSVLSESGMSGLAYRGAVFASVIGSNLGACLTPLGALAGLMWTALLTRSGIRFSFRSFIRYGILISLPALLAALLGLWIVLG